MMSDAASNLFMGSEGLPSEGWLDNDREASENNAETGVPIDNHMLSLSDFTRLDLLTHENTADIPDPILAHEKLCTV